MAIIEIPGLPAVRELREELSRRGTSPRIQTEEQAKDSDPLRIAVLNLMPVKEQTERQLLRRLMASELLCRVSFFYPAMHEPKHVSKEHLEAFYRSADHLYEEPFDGFIMTGAPVEHLAFQEVDYWEELTKIMDESDRLFRSKLFICWGAQAALYHYYGVSKRPLPSKMFGVFSHELTKEGKEISLGNRLSSPFMAPHSRHTYTPKEEILSVKELLLVAESREAGVYLAADPCKSRYFVTGHSEYDPDTLHGEYQRDLLKGRPIEPPRNYYEADDPSLPPLDRWRDHSEELFDAWLKETAGGSRI